MKKWNNSSGLCKRALSIAEASAYACVSRGTLETWLSNGLLPFELLPGRGKGAKRLRRVRREDLDLFLSSCYQQPDKPQVTPSSKPLTLQPCEGKR